MQKARENRFFIVMVVRMGEHRSSLRGAALLAALAMSGLLVVLGQGGLAPGLPRETRNIVTVAGMNTVVNDGRLATSAVLNAPTNIAFDPSGNLFIVDTQDNRIRKIDAQGIITTVAGTGDEGYSGDGGPAVLAELNFPRCVVFDRLGNFYINDTGSIRKVDTKGIITTVAGTGILGFSGDGGPATSAQIGFPFGLVVDSSGNLYAADQLAHRVRKVDTRGIITTVAGTGVAGFSGEAGPATAAQLNTPRGLAMDSSGNLYIGDTNNRRVRKVDTAGIITTVAGTGVAGFSGDGGSATSAQLNGLFGVAMDSSGTLYIADRNNNRVRKVNTDGIITTVAGTGVAGFSGDGGSATAAQINLPRSMAVDSAGNLYIADSNNNRIRKVATTGLITSVAGTGAALFSGDGGPAIAAELNNTFGMAFDSARNLYFADLFNHRVRRVDTKGIVTTVAGTGVAGFRGDGGLASAAQLSRPRGIAVDSSGNLYILDTGNHRIRKVAANGIITSVAGTGVAGFSGDGGPATAAQLNTPIGITVDSSGNLYIADFINNRIRKVATDGIMTTVAGTGAAGFSGDGGSATGAQLNRPLGIAVDSAGNIYFGDSVNNRVRKIDTKGIITTVAGTGVAGFLGDGGLATAAQLDIPAGVALDLSGNLYIADSNNSHIRKVDTQGIITIAAGPGVSMTGSKGDGGPATSAKMDTPLGIAFDPSGNLYIADQFNNRIRRLNLNARVSLSMSGQVITANITLPVGWNPNDINPSSVRLQGINPTNGAVRFSTGLPVTTLQTPVVSGARDTVADANNDAIPDTRILQFDRTTVAAWPSGVLRVEGQFNNGTYFSGDQ
jgi:sugar lactone lactonase YvrE